MKLVVRALVLGVFAAGASAAVASYHNANAMTASNFANASHQVMTAAFPIPGCNACGGL